MKKPNIVFLDFDGVICTPRACLAMGDFGQTFRYLDPIACNLVIKLCEKTNAKIVISSSWRKRRTFNHMADLMNCSIPRFGSYLFRYDEDSWKTGTNNTSINATRDNPNPEFTNRSLEIEQWISEYSTHFNRFVILDDTYIGGNVKDSHVKCDAYDGMGFHQYMEALKILQHEDDGL